MTFLFIFSSLLKSVMFFFLFFACLIVHVLYNWCCSSLVYLDWFWARNSNVKILGTWTVHLVRDLSSVELSIALLIGIAFGPSPLTHEALLR